MLVLLPHQGRRAGGLGDAAAAADSPRPKAAVVAVVVELELASDHSDQGEDAPGRNAVPASDKYYSTV